MNGLYRSMDADNGAGGGSSPATPPATPPTTPTGGDQPGQEGGGAGAAVPAAPISMTPAQLNERLERAKGAERTALLKSLGFEKVEDLQKAVKDADDLRKAQLTEAERQAAELKTAKEQATTQQARADKAEADRRQALIRSEAVELMAGRFARPGTAFKLLDLAGVEVQADGAVKGLAEAVEKLAKDEPWTLVQAAPDGKKTAATNIGPTNPDGSGKPKVTDDERRQRYFGGGSQSGFFQGSGVKPEVNKKPK